MLTKNSVASEELAKRTRSAIEKNLSDYYLFEIDKNPVACVAFTRIRNKARGNYSLPLR